MDLDDVRSALQRIADDEQESDTDRLFASVLLQLLPMERN